MKYCACLKNIFAPFPMKNNLRHRIGSFDLQKKIEEGRRGLISVQSQLDQGTTFRVACL
jgi:hypothetical protein